MNSPGWSNLKHLTLANVSSLGYLDSSKVFFYSSAAQEKDGGGGRVDVTFDLPERWGDDGYEMELMRVVASELSSATGSGERIVGPRFGRVVVKVRSEEEGWRLEKMVEEEGREIVVGGVGKTRRWGIEVVGEEEGRRRF